jgi:Uma2 family endonuclease
MSATTLLTFRDFEQLPSVLDGKQELLNGELITMPPPNMDHTQTAHAFLFYLVKILGSRVWVEAGYKMGENWLQPDVSVTWPDQQLEHRYLIGAPMIAIEIISEHKSRDQIDDRIEAFFAHGCREVWVISRRKRAMTVYTQNEAGAIVGTRVTTEYRPVGIDVTIRPADLIVS